MKDEHELLVELIKGSEKAFVALYDLYWEKLYYTCFQRIRLKEESEDILHELFLDLWNRKDKLEIKSSFAVYIFTALKYKIYRFIDSRNSRSKYVERLGEEEPASHHKLERELEFNELYNLIECKIEELPEKCRLIFRMSRNEQMDAKEISEQLNLSESTVQNQITKAKKILKEELQKYFMFLFI
jgi:RNA polymerase sigma-70 factor (family 1)